MKKQQYRLRPNFSTFLTASATPGMSPAKIGRTSFIQPTVSKQKLHIKNKQNPQKMMRLKCNHKPRYSSILGSAYENKIQRKPPVSWITFNILVSIYKNWLRLAPFIIHLLKHTKKDKVSDIEKMMENAKKQSERLQKLFQKSKNYRISFNVNHYNQQSNYNNFDEQLLQQISLLCKQVKFSTQLLNGEILAKKRIFKTEKQNNLTEDLLNSLQKNKSKAAFINDEMAKVAETIVDRIAVVKYLKRNKIKIDESILKPLKNIFKSSQNIEDQQQMTAASVIQKIKSKFIKQAKNKNERKQLNCLQEFKDSMGFRKLRQTTKSIKFLDNQNDIDSEQSLEKQNDTENALSVYKKRTQRDIFSRNYIPKQKNETKKKIGFLLQSDLSQQDQVNFKNEKKKTPYELYNQRRVILDREVTRTKVKTIMTDIKNQIQDISKNKQLRQQKQKKKIKIEAQRQQKEPVPDNGKQKQLQKNNADRKKIMSKKLIGTQEARSSKSSSIQDQLSQPKQSRKFLKQGKLLRKRNFKKSSNGFDLFDLQNFDLELKAEENVIAKKKKILNFFNNLQAEGVITTKSLKKIVNYAKKIQNEAKTKRSQKKPRNNNMSEDGAMTSFFMIPHYDENGQSEHKLQQCRPYNYLLNLNKQAVQNWIPNYDNFSMLKLAKYPKHRLSNFDCDLDIPIIRKQLNSKHETKWFDRQSKAIEFCLQMTRQYNRNTLHQKSIQGEQQCHKQLLFKQ